MYTLAISVDHPAPTEFKRRVGRAFTTHDLIVAISSGVRMADALAYNKEHQVAHAPHWVLWRPAGEAPIGIDVIELVTKAEMGDLS
jgi:hypothetical protein